MPYAIIRPTLVFGEGDVLLKNMTWACRHFPEFAVSGIVDYSVQPIYSEDVAAEAIDAGSRVKRLVPMSLGLDTFTFQELLCLPASLGGGPNAVGGGAHSRRG